MQSTFQCDILRLSHEGRGIASVDGKTTFVVGGLVGEKVEAVRISRHGRYDEARALQVIAHTASHRVTPLCPVFGQCGGCTLQHLSHKAQVAHKVQMLQDVLRTIGGVTEAPIAPAIIGTDPYHYRTKARLGVRVVPKKGGVLVGFREQSSNKLTVMDECPILARPVSDWIAPLKACIATLEAASAIAQIEVAIADNETALVWRHLQPLSDTDQARLIEFAQMHGAAIYLQPGGPTTVHRLWPVSEQLLSYRLPEFDITYWYHPLDFTQINLGVNQQMVKQACNWLALEPQDTVLDLFCGLGNFSLAMARQAGSVLGIEGVGPMIERARYNAKYNAIANVQFEVQDLSDAISTQSWIGGQYDKVLLDPPRTGAEAVVRQLGRMTVKRIVYVSCQPATLARDTRILLDSGRYRLVQVGLLDMFPHTEHAEAMALFEGI